MSYGLIYTIPFSSSLGKNYRVEIEKENYSGESFELVADESPFVVNCESDDFIYTPIRTSTATLNVFGNDYLQELYSTEYRQYRVILKESDKVLWCGFVKPEVYTQEYGDEDFTLSIECVSAIEVLDKLDYKNDNRDFISLWDLIKYCLTESHGVYDYIYVPFVYFRYSEESATPVNILSNLKVSAQNFFDEDDESMTCKEILEEISKIMNWTLVDYGGDLYFVDVDNLGGKYLRSKIDNDNWELVSIESNNVQLIGYDGDNHTLDILGGYNKVTIKCSNYPVGDALPDTSFDELSVLTTKDEKTAQSVTGGYKVSHYKFYKSKSEKYKLIPYRYNSETDDLTEISEEDLIQYIQETPKWELASITGAIPYKYDDYEEDSKGNANIIDYEYSETIRIKTSRGTSQVLIFSQNNRIPIIKIKGSSAAYFQGAFSINFDLYMLALSTSGIVDYDFHFQLRIGNKYFHGKSGGSEYYWDDNSEIIIGEYDNNLRVNFGDDNNDYNGPYTLISSRKLGDGLNGVKGYICKIPDNEVLSGDVELTIYGPYASFVLGGLRPDYFSLSDFEFNFNKYEDSEEEDSDSDRIYENVINESYVNELDEIELKISTYNQDGACFSKLVIDNKYLEDNLHCLLVNKVVRLEELLIQRIVSYYQKSHLKLTQQLVYHAISPASMLTDDSQPDKTFIYVGGEIDYQQDTMSVIMIEKE